MSRFTQASVVHPLPRDFVSHTQIDATSLERGELIAVFPLVIGFETTIERSMERCGQLIQAFSPANGLSVTLSWKC